MSEEYRPQELEAEMQARWEAEGAHRCARTPSGRKYYCLAMFPYPSGSLHMGHVRNYSIADALARYKRMRGFEVLHPMGWDAFGLPAENAAIERGEAPEDWTRANIDSMRAQLRRLGFCYDWEREFATCDPDYYRWEQWLFLKLFEKGLAYRSTAEVNWDPVDNTVLANEQVVDGRGWRSGAVVERREIPQWSLRITRYAEELLRDLDQLDGHWPPRVLAMQRNWIGRSEGLRFHFAIEGRDETLEVFTTRADTLMGATFVALAPGHPLLDALEDERDDLREFRERMRHAPMTEAGLATMEKEGVDTGLRAAHPISGEALPVWAANFVLLEYGTGAIMSVPAHDERDLEFARRYDLPVRQVIAPENGDWDLADGAFTAAGRLINSGEFDGLDSDDAKTRIAETLAADGGRIEVRYRLRDWSVSRQRYWGAPIPMIHCDDCGAVPAPEETLPVELPPLPEDRKLIPLGENEAFCAVDCPSCGAAARRETDTFDTFMESSWYYARFASFDSDDAMLDEGARGWLPVDQYVGGIEHAVLHLLYARFFHKLMRDIGLVDGDEPFAKLLSQGMVLKDGKKMSKSMGNTVNPDDLIRELGADAVRLYTLFAAPPDQSLEWSDKAAAGARRFLNRLWRLVEESTNDDGEAADGEALELRRKTHRTIQRVGDDYERAAFNTAIAAVMELCNDVGRLDADAPGAGAARAEALSAAVRLLAPIAPHICEALWEKLGHATPLRDSGWPSVEAEMLRRERNDIVVQVDGKVRARIEADAGADEATLREAALAAPNVRRFTEDVEIRRVVVVPDKLVNIVTG